MREHFISIQESKMKDFVLVMDKIYTKCKFGTKYILSEEKLNEDYADYIKEKYAEEGKTLLNYFISIYIYIYTCRAT